ncbi:hypothetical protein JXD38_06055 [candidate division WOR-3 bacterium]|nr:hypothetical protein [candidate division WOR-3 bacterium]
MKRYFIRPLDTLFCRDGRPFDAGVDSEAASVFPPPQRTVYGAFRAAVLATDPNHRWGEDTTDNSLKKVVGDRRNKGDLTLLGPLVARTDPLQALFPTPLDVVRNPDTRQNVLLSPDGPELAGCSNLGQKGLRACVPPSEVTAPVEPARGLLLEGGALLNYLAGIAPQGLVADATLYRPEYRVGLKLGRVSRTAEAGFLYSAVHTRPANLDYCTGLVVEVGDDGGRLPEWLTLRLGGESRPADCREVADFDWSPYRERVRERVLVRRRFKALLTAPGLFPKNGWYPDFINGTTMTGTIPGTDLAVKLVGACVGRSVPAGGFNILTGPKPTTRAVPAGSVYFFEPVNAGNGAAGLVEKFVEVLHGPVLVPKGSQDPDDWKEGFNSVLIGGW